MKRKRRQNKGQTTVEFILLLAFAAFLSIEIVKFFQGIFQEGFSRLEGNVQEEVKTGREFKL